MLVPQVRREDYTPKPTVVNAADYKGRLLLLPGRSQTPSAMHAPFPFVLTARQTANSHALGSAASFV